MKELFAAKYDELWTEFNRYILEHPKFLARLPNEALIVLLDKRDPDYCTYALKRMRRYLKNDDRSRRPIVYIDVGKLAPPKSRILRPTILRKAPEFAWCTPPSRTRAPSGQGAQYRCGPTLGTC